MKIKDIALRSLPYIVAVAVFFVVSALYFAPQFDDKTLVMNDVQMYDGMKADISKHRAEFGEDPQWTGGMFGGMPAYLISVQYPAMFLRNAAQSVLGLLGEPMSLMFLAMVGFWVMLLLAGINPWVAIAPAIAYGLSTYNILIIEAGHITKMRAMGYAPMLLGAVFWTFRRATGCGGFGLNAPKTTATNIKTGVFRDPGIWIGGGLAALFGTLLIAASHHQITYYFLLVVVAYWLNNLVVTARAQKSERKRLWVRFGAATTVLAGAAILAVGANFSHLWYTFEHSPETIRGGSEISAAGTVGDTGADSENDSPKNSKGLDLQYATAWSYGIGESMNMFIPNLRGGGSSGGFKDNGEVATALRINGINSSFSTQLPGYWGDQPFTGGPTYLGAVMVFFCVLGLFVLPARKKWWVVGVSLLGLFLAWGSNMLWFTELAFKILPGYNKFRTVSMALVILQWSIPFLAALAANELWDKQLERRKLMRGLWWSLGITGGLALFFALLGGMIFDFSAVGDAQFADFKGLTEAMRDERAAMLRADSWRSLILVLLTAAVVWASINLHKINRLAITAAIFTLGITDLVPVDLRYLSWSDFQTRSRTEVKPDEIDREIMADSEPGFRVFNTENPFNEALTSYFHRSVGGYHGAKLRRYQDVIDRYLSKFDMAALNMLNTKYFMLTDPETGERFAEPNPDANGAAWFVDEVIFADGAREELDALGTIDNKHQAVVDQRFTSLVKDFVQPSESAAEDIGAGVELVEYRPNYLKYETLSAEPRLAVFSEIYYDKGWKAYIDGEPTPYVRADYILRAMVVPAGTHTIEWRFRAPHFAAAEGITLGCSIAILLWLASAAFFEWRQRKLKNNLID